MMASGDPGFQTNGEAESASHARIETAEFRFKGRAFNVPMTRIDGYEIIAPGRWLRIAVLNDEEWIEGRPMSNAAPLIEKLRASGLPADIFAFSSPLDTETSYATSSCEPDNVAAIRTDDYKAWWDGLPQEGRKNARLAAKRGVELRVVPFDDALIAGIKVIYDETPIRQGRKFWHYGKDIDTIRRENGTYLDRAEFIGAFHDGQLIGFLKYVVVDNTGRLMQILSLNTHRDKRVMVALIAKAAELCHQRGLKYFIYGKLTYGRKTGTSIEEFKRRLGFQRVDIKRCYLPLTLRGRAAMLLGVHRGWHANLPAPVIDALLRLRTWWLQRGATGDMRSG